MVGCFLGCLADDRDAQALADHGCDLPERHALVGHPVIPASGRTFLQDKPVEVGSVEPMHGGPAVQTVANIGGNALLTRDVDEERNETMIAVAMNRGWPGGRPKR